MSFGYDVCLHSIETTYDVQMCHLSLESLTYAPSFFIINLLIYLFWAPLFFQSMQRTLYRIFLAFLDRFVQ